MSDFNYLCSSCIHISKKSGKGAYFIFTCEKWGLISKRIMPCVTVKQSIGENCPFYVKRILPEKKDRHTKSGGLDIIV